MIEEFTDLAIALKKANEITKDNDLMKFALATKKNVEARLRGEKVEPVATISLKDWKDKLVT